MLPAEVHLKYSSNKLSVLEFWMTQILDWTKIAPPALLPYSQMGGRESVQVLATRSTITSDMRLGTTNSCGREGEICQDWLARQSLRLGHSDSSRIFSQTEVERGWTFTLAVL